MPPTGEWIKELQYIHTKYDSVIKRTWMNLKKIMLSERTRHTGLYYVVLLI